MTEEIAPGTIIDGRYRIDRKVGEGGFGVVYAGLHMTLGVPIALKALRLPEDITTARRAELLAEFVEEARVLTRLRHDNVVRTLDQGLLPADAEGNRSPYLVMEWCGDDSLRGFLAKRGATQMPIGAALAIIRGIVRGVAHAHEQGIAHRDLKPGNVMISLDGMGMVVPRIIDFGIAKLFDREEGVGTGDTQTKSVVGRFTPAYAAPEQALGSRTGPWTDVHALGLLFVELLTGDDPYDRETGLLAIVDPKRPTPASKGFDVGALEAVIERALALKPADRFRDAGELELALTEAARSVQLDTTLPAVAGSKPPQAKAVEDTEAAPSRTLLTADRGTGRGVTEVRPRAVWTAALIGGLGLGAAAAFAVFREAEPGSPGVEATTSSEASAAPSAPPSASVAPPIIVAPEGRLSTLDSEQIWKLMISVGLEPIKHERNAQGQAMIHYRRGAMDGAVYLNKVPMHERVARAAYPLAALYAVRTWIAADRTAGYELAYVVDENWVLSMSALRSARPDEKLMAIFDKLTRGLHSDVRGSSWYGPDPANNAAQSRPTWTAKHLGEMVDFELLQRIEVTGATASMTVVPPHRLTYAIKRGADVGQIDVFSEPHSSGRPGGAAFLKELGAAKRPHAYAEHVTETVVSQGSGAFARKAFLDEVLAGLGANAHEAAP